MTDEEYAAYQQREAQLAYSRYVSNCSNARNFEAKINECNNKIKEYKEKKSKYESFKGNAGNLISAVDTLKVSIGDANQAYFSEGGIVSSKSRNQMSDLKIASTNGADSIKAPVEQAQAFCDTKINEYSQKIEEEQVKIRRI